MELERSSWPRKKMEFEHSTAAGLSALLRPRATDSAGGSAAVARGGCAVPVMQTPPSSSSMLSAAVREVLLAQRCEAAKKKPRVLPGGDAERQSQGSCVTAKAEAKPAERAAAVAATRQALAKRVARRMLRRGRAAEHEGGNRVVLACCCQRLPPGLRCALHQAVAVAPREPCRRGGWAFGEYARWRSSVWMPSRFCLERVGQAARGRPCMDRDRAPRPALLIGRTGRCAGVSVRRFVLVRDTEQARQEM